MTDLERCSCPSELASKVEIKPYIHPSDFHQDIMGDPEAGVLQRRQHPCCCEHPRECLTLIPSDLDLRDLSPT